MKTNTSATWNNPVSHHSIVHQQCESIHLTDRWVKVNPKVTGSFQCSTVGNSDITVTNTTAHKILRLRCVLPLSNNASCFSAPQQMENHQYIYLFLWKCRAKGFIDCWFFFPLINHRLASNTQSVGLFTCCCQQLIFCGKRLLLWQ